MGRGLIVDRHGIKMAAVVCMSIIVFFAMALVPPIANADCPDLLVSCYKDDDIKGPVMGTYFTGSCWHWDFTFCTPCASDADLKKQCNDKFPECEGRCIAKVQSTGPW